MNTYVRIYAMGAQLYTVAGDKKTALKLLEKCINACINDFFPLKLTTDKFFDKIDPWINKMLEKSPIPRSEPVVKESMLNDFLLSPAFESLHDTEEFKILVKKMKNFIKNGGK
jgi:hypothetical protein